ncbi:hypothetical protein ACFL0V_01445 [Nanoarchaeota archaeon]
MAYDTDVEFAIGLADHIRNPCVDLDGNNIRDFYIRQAEKVMDSLNRPAQAFLRSVLVDYQK